MVDFNKFNTFIFDLDGTIWIYPNVIESAKEVIEKLKEKGKQVLIVTNFTMLSRDEIADRLKQNGVDVNENEIITASYVIGLNLEEDSSVYVIGDGVRRELENLNIGFSEGDVTHLVVGHDKDFNYQKLVKCLQVLKRSAEFWVTSLGKVFLTSNGIYPGTGSIVRSIEYASDRKPVLFGKPSDYMRLAVEINVTSPRKETIFIGDEIDDIKFARMCGYKSALVLTGLSKEIDKKIKPNFVLKDLKEIVKDI